MRPAARPRRHRARARLARRGQPPLRFPTEDPMLDVVRVRPFDVATFVAFGAAQIGICGADVLMEFDYPEIYAPLDLGIGACRVSVAEPRRPPAWTTRPAGPACAWRPSTPTSRAGITPRAASMPRSCISTARWSWRPAWAWPADRRPRGDRLDAEGQRAGGDRGDRPRHQPPDRQPHGAEDAARGSRRLDRAVPRGAGRA